MARHPELDDPELTVILEEEPGRLSAIGVTEARELLVSLAALIEVGEPPRHDLQAVGLRGAGQPLLKGLGACVSQE